MSTVSSDVVVLNDMISQSVRQSMTEYLQSNSFKSVLEQNGVLFKGQQQPIATSIVGTNENQQRKRKFSDVSSEEEEVEEEKRRESIECIEMSGSEEDGEILDDEEDDFFGLISKKEETVGPEISNTLAESTNKALSSELDMKQVESLCEETIRPKNCQALVLPKLNPELHESSRHKQLMKTQALAIKSLIRGVNLCDKIGKYRKEKKLIEAKEIIADMQKMVHLQLSVVNSLNYRRMEEVRERVDKKYIQLVGKPFANNPKGSRDTSLLCGTDLGKEMENVDKSKKVSQAMDKRKHYSSNHHNQVNKRSKNGNRPQNHSAAWNLGAHQKTDKKKFYKKKTYKREFQQHY